jgi:hypothetical protein
MTDVTRTDELDLTRVLLLSLITVALDRAPVDVLEAVDRDLQAVGAARNGGTAR